MACCLRNERGNYLGSFWQGTVSKETSLLSSNNKVLSQNPIFFFFFWKSTRHSWGARWGWGKKKIGARFEALGIRTPPFLVPVQLKL